MMTNPPEHGWPGGPPPAGRPTPGQPPHPYPGQAPLPGQHSARHPAQQPYPPSQNPAPHPAYPPVPEPPARPGGQPAFDPTKALGEPPPAAVSIDQFRPPPNRTPLLVTIGALVVLALVLGVGTYLRLQPVQPSASPSPSASAPAAPGQPFDTPDGQQSGRWEILEHKWLDEGLQLRVRVSSDKGPITFRFRAFGNASSEAISPSSSIDAAPDIRSGTASPAAPVTGYVFFAMPRQDATIILTTGGGFQMSALPVTG